MLKLKCTIKDNKKIVELDETSKFDFTIIKKENPYDFKVIHIISFDVDKETLLDLSTLYGGELIAEKLKQDFLKFMKNGFKDK